MKHYFLNQRFKPTLLNVRTIRKYIGNMFERMAVDAEKSGQVQLIVSEVLVNFVEHTDPSPTVVLVRISRENTQWVLEILDNGVTFDDFEEKSKSAENDLMSEGGRGLFLLREYFPDTEYRKKDPNEADGFNTLYIGLGKLEDHRPALLLVDDDVAHSQLLYHYLEAPFRVTLCEDVASAFIALTNDTYDLILSDIQMPGCSGLEFRQRLIAEGISDAIPFIFITGEEDDSLSYSASDLHIDDYLIKPVKKGQLIRVVQRVLKRSSQVKLQLIEHFGRQLTRMLQPALGTKMGQYDCEWYDLAAEAGGGDMILAEYMRDKTVVFFADLMGHGIQAKYYAHALAGYVRGMLINLDDDVEAGGLLTQISNAFYKDKVLSSTMMTCVVVVAHADGRIELANGGQPPPLVSNGEEWTAITVEGYLPGLLENADYETYHLRLEPKQKLFISSDGIWEFGSNPKTRLEHEDSVRAALQKLATQGNLKEQTTEFIKQFTEMVAGNPSDDVTVLVLSGATEAS
jgi:sigma-B regulation protein RsbU (phosphoserine phosphatase)